jgi:hypothetical protein
MYVKHLKIKLIDDVDSFLEHLRLLLGAEIGHTKNWVDASAAHGVGGTRGRDKRLSLKSAGLPFDQVSKASLQSPWTSQMLQVVNISESFSMTNTHSAKMPPFPAHSSVGSKGAIDKKSERNRPLLRECGAFKWPWNAKIEIEVQGG